MKILSAHHINEFIVCCGYKGYVIKEYFANYSLHTSDITFDLSQNSVQVHRRTAEPWKITLVDTGDNTMTGGRLLRVRDYLGDSSFLFAYGDGLSDIHITALLAHHKDRSTEATVTAVQPPGRFGVLQFGNQSSVIGFEEKPTGDGSWINGGLFVLEPTVLSRIEDDHTIWEHGPLTSLSTDRQLTAFKHYGFWQPMDTLRDRNYLEHLWSNNIAPWRIW